MSLLDVHLDQIELCSSTISELPFPKPKIFTNAMIHNHDITALIRDTEAHERALFMLAPPQNLTSAQPSSNTPRRRTVFPGEKPGGVRPQPKKNTAVAAVLGGDLAERIRRERARDHQSSRRAGGQKDDIDVELLLRGAEKLYSVYPVPGAAERIALLRDRNAKAVASIEEYEGLAVEQIAQLTRLNRPTSFKYDDEDTTMNQVEATIDFGGNDFAESDVEVREADIAELERKKKQLEERVQEMDKDLGGLMR